MRTACQSAKPSAKPRLCHFRDLQHRRGTCGLLRGSTAPRVIHLQGEVIDRVLGHTLPVCDLCGCLPQPHPAGG